MHIGLFIIIFMQLQMKHNQYQYHIQSYDQYQYKITLKDPHRQSPAYATSPVSISSQFISLIAHIPSAFIKTPCPPSPYSSRASPSGSLDLPTLSPYASTPSFD